MLIRELINIANLVHTHFWSRHGRFFDVCCFNTEVMKTVNPSHTGRLPFLVSLKHYLVRLHRLFLSMGWHFRFQVHNEGKIRSTSTHTETQIFLGIMNKHANTSTSKETQPYNHLYCSATEDNNFDTTNSLIQHQDTYSWLLRTVISANQVRVRGVEMSLTYTAGLRTSPPPPLQTL